MICRNRTVSLIAMTCSLYTAWPGPHAIAMSAGAYGFFDAVGSTRQTQSKSAKAARSTGTTDTTSAAATAGAPTTPPVVGTTVSALPVPCPSFIIEGKSYSHCGNAWYQLQLSGSSLQYTVVNPPR